MDGCINEYMLFCLSYLLCYVIKDVTMRTDQTHCSFFLTCGVYGIDSTVFVYLLYVPFMYEFKVKSDMDSFCKPWFVYYFRNSYISNVLKLLFFILFKSIFYISNYFHSFQVIYTILFNGLPYFLWQCRDRWYTHHNQ